MARWHYLFTGNRRWVFSESIAARGTEALMMRLSARVVYVQLTVSCQQIRLRRLHRKIIQRKQHGS